MSFASYIFAIESIYQINLKSPAPFLSLVLFFSSEKAASMIFLESFYSVFLYLCDIHVHKQYYIGFCGFVKLHYRYNSWYIWFVPSYFWDFSIDTCRSGSLAGSAMYSSLSHSPGVHWGRCYDLHFIHEKTEGLKWCVIDQICKRTSTQIQNEFHPFKSRLLTPRSPCRSSTFNLYNH